MCRLLVQSAALVCLMAIAAAGLSWAPSAPSARAGGAWSPTAPQGRDCGGTVLLAAKQPAAHQQIPQALAAGGGTSWSWNSAADFYAGYFAHTEVVTNSAQVTLLRRWSTNIRVNDDSGMAAQHQPSMAVDGDDTAYAAWQDDRHGDPDIAVASRPSGQQAWSGAVIVNDDDASAVQQNPSLVAGAGGRLFVAWEDRRNGNADIYTAGSTDGGLTWSANNKASDDETAADQTHPSLVLARNGVLYLAWEDWRNGSPDIYVAASSDGGLSWSPNYRVDDDETNAAQTSPSLAAGADSALYAVWQDARGGTAEIRSAASHDGGRSWSDSLRVSPSAGGSEQEAPSLAVGPDDLLYVAWQDFRQTLPAIYAAASRDGGLNWSSAVMVSDGAGSAAAPGTAVDPYGTALTFWCQSANGIDGIYVARSTSGGAAWHQPVRVDRSVANEADTANRGAPSLATTSGGGLHIAWHDDRDGSPDIYSAFWPTLGVYLEGSFTSQVLDAGSSVDWDSLSWETTLPSTTAISVALRVGDSPTPGRGWTDWRLMRSSPADLSGLPPARYAQWRGGFATGSERLTPSLEWLTLSWKETLYLPFVSR